ncbi:MAG: hypothetical protein V4733_00715 [Verrucomicrobiota bacterium]
MITLAEKLGETTPSSLLVRKAVRLGINDHTLAIRLAVQRGCRHYATPGVSSIEDPGHDRFSDEELTILLLSGQNPYDPTAIRCAAQLARSPHVSPTRLALLAERFKTRRVLAHIARAGSRHDPEGATFWLTLLSSLSSSPERAEPDLPHWSRFVSMPGIQRHGPAPVRWLTPYR